MKKEREPIAYAEDWIKEYADSRKALTEKDVKELVRCMLGYIKMRLRSNEIYALELPYLGILYRKFDINQVPYYNISDEEKLMDRMFLNKILKPKSPCNRPPRFDNHEREYLQNHTNDRED